MKNKILVGLVIFLVAIQFIRPERNLSDDQTYSISTKYAVTDEVNGILKVACNDCHSNKTEYPWYANVQPVASWLAHHVEEGKDELNLSTFTKLPIAVQNHKLEETIEMVKEGEMPLASYTFFGLHKEANLTEDQKKVLIDWAKAQMDTLKANYPADSLVLKRRKKPE